MKTLYLDCSMGAAGDMLASALSELVEDSDSLLNKIQIPHVQIEKKNAVRSGISGTHIDVTVDAHHEDESMHEHHHHHHHHHSLKDIHHIVSHLDLSEKVKRDVMEVYTLIAQAEASVHNQTMDNIHFHEVGTRDAIADICMVCSLMEAIHPDQVIASPIHVGKGTVRCAHGILPVPAPATALLLQGIPMYAKDIESELCTPTGAALLKYYVDRFQEMPLMRVEKTGYGMGTKEFEQANCIRAFLGQTQQKSAENILELECNIDDMSAEELGYAMDVLLASKAREVFITPVIMKKNRPAQLLHVLCDEENQEEIVRLIFKHTSTIGIRIFPCTRYILDREEKEIQTSYGIIRKKISYGYGVKKEKWEYEDLLKVAQEQGISISEVKENIKERNMK